MAFYPKLTEPQTTRLFTQVFQGYNRNLRTGDGEFSFMKNLSSDAYPLLSQRKRRSTYSTLRSPYALSSKESLVFIDGTKLYINGFEVVGISLIESDEPKQIVSMGAYICVFPDAVYVNTMSQETDYGTMATEFHTAGGSSAVSLSLCDINGAAFTGATKRATAPDDHPNGTYWIDDSVVPNVLRRYSETSLTWVDIPTVYTKISYPDIGKNFSVYDGVTISGLSSEDIEIKNQVAALNAPATIYAKGDDYIIIVGLISKSYSQTDVVTIERKVPKMDYVIESGNRLWGCFYGMKDGKPVNEIYCCKLGDFKNWNSFLGVSVDSYAVTVGTDGPFTGAVTHLGYPLFFKENCIHKIYGKFPSEFQVITMDCRGVQKGCFRSLQIVNEVLYYKSQTDICAFDGSLPTSVSYPLDREPYYDAVAGSLENKYYISMRDGSCSWHLFVYDAGKTMWHREDNTQAIAFARAYGDLFYIDADSKKIMAVNGTSGDLEGPISWEAVTGVIGYEYPDSKYLSRFNLRMNLPVGSTCDLYAMYDSSGTWVHMAHMDGRGTDSFTFPVRPRRCDHMQLKLSGMGEIKLYSLAKILEVGSDV